MSKRKLYIVTGLPYAGKTFVSNELIRRFSLQYVSVDDEITLGHYNVAAMDQNDWNKVYSSAYGKLRELLSQGEAVLFDGASLKRSERDNLRGIAASLNASYVLIYMKTPAEEIRRRWVENEGTKARGQLEKGDLEKALAMFEEPTTDEHPVIFSPDLDLTRWVEKNIKL